jgi:chromosomal replication initiation ATPase DnaA
MIEQTTQEALGYILSCTVKRDPVSFRPKIQNILNRVAGYFHKHPSWLFVKDRKTERVYARQLCIYLLRDENITERETAEIFGIEIKVVSYHRAKIKGFLKVDESVQEDVKALTQPTF